MSLPVITQLQFETQETKTVPKMGKSFSYDFKKGDFVKVDGRLEVIEDKEALELWITKAIMTEFYRFRVYDDVDYGTVTEGLIGTNYPQAFIESELQREITLSVTRHELIDHLEDFSFERLSDEMMIYFTVITTDGAFEMEVSM